MKPRLNLHTILAQVIRGKVRRYRGQHGSRRGIELKEYGSSGWCYSESTGELICRDRFGREVERFRIEFHEVF